MSGLGNEVRYTCQVKGCGVTFAREGDRVRHRNEKHEGLKKCPVKDCPWKGAKRQDRVRKHLKDKHDLFDVELDFVLPDTSEHNHDGQNSYQGHHQISGSGQTVDYTNTQYSSPNSTSADGSSPQGSSNSPPIQTVGYAIPAPKNGSGAVYSQGAYDATGQHDPTSYQAYDPTTHTNPGAEDWYDNESAWYGNEYGNRY